MDKIVNDFNNSIVLSQKDLISDYFEIGIDYILKNELFREIPIIKTIIGGIETTISIRDRKLLNNLITFIRELNSGDINNNKLIKYQERLNKNPKYAEQELGRFLVILDQTIEKEKVILLGKIFKAYINEIINWDEVVEFIEITNGLFIYDIKLLNIMWKKEYNNYIEIREDAFRIDRISSLGILGNVIPSKDNINHLHGKVLNNLGKKYCDIIFN